MCSGMQRPWRGVHSYSRRTILGASSSSMQCENIVAFDLNPEILGSPSNLLPAGLYDYNILQMQNRSHVVLKIDPTHEI